MCYTFCLSMDFHRRLPPAAAALPRRPRRPFRACAAWRPRRSPRHRSRRRCPTAWDDEPWKMGRWVDVWGWVDRISYGSTVLDGFQWVLWVGCGLMIWRSQNPVVRTWLARAWYFWWTGRLGWCRVYGNILQEFDSCCQHLALFTVVVVLWCSLDMRIRSPGNRMP